MKRGRIFIALAALASSVLLVAGPARADDPIVEMTSNGGIAGLEPLISSTSPCPAAGGQRFVRVSSTAMTIGPVYWATQSDGSWTARLGNTAGTPAGTYSVNVVCISRMGASEAITQTYQPIDYVVTAPQQAPTLQVTAPLFLYDKFKLSSFAPCPSAANTVQVVLDNLDNGATYTGGAVPSPPVSAGGSWSGSFSPRDFGADPGRYRVSAACVGQYDGPNAVPYLWYKSTAVITVRWAYVALGDSFSSGEGSPPFDRGTDTGADNCHRSDSAWNAVLAQRYGYTFQNVACSGAVINQLSTGKSTEPGQYRQLRDFIAAKSAPQYVSVTIGGNDLGFSSVLRSCRLPVGGCLSNVAEKKREIDAVAKRLRTDVLPALAKASPKSRIVVVGYPSLFPKNPRDLVNCSWLSGTEANRLWDVSSYLDAKYAAVTKAAAQDLKRIITYASTLKSMAGHELCTKNSWMNPITAKFTNWFNNPLQGHPTPAGYRAMANAASGHLYPGL